VDLVLGVAETRTAALALVEKYQSSRMADRAFDLAWTHSQVTLRQLNATEARRSSTAGWPARWSTPTRAAGRPGRAAHNRRGQSGLWSYGISGDAPIVLLRISDLEKIELVRQLIQAHSYWRMKGLTVDLVILNEDTSVYRQSLRTASPA
jgi:cyclic beta-1,2-glucan synthetase